MSVLTTPAPQQSIAQAPTAPPAQALVCNGNTAPAESYVCGTSGVVYTASEYSALQASLGACTALAGANSTKCGSFVLANDAYQAVAGNTCAVQCQAATAACPGTAPAPAPGSLGEPCMLLSCAKTPARPAMWVLDLTRLTYKLLP